MSSAPDDSVALVEELGTELERLLEALTRAGLESSPRERIAAAALTASLVSAGSVRTIAELKPMLAPLLARSPDERRLFFQVLDAPPENGKAEVRREARSWSPVLGLALLLIGAAGFLWWVQQPTPVVVQRSVEVRPSPPPVLIATEAPKAGQKAADIESLNRVAEAAIRFEGTPTIEELGRAFAEERRLDWPAESYAIRLHEFSGLPRGEPLPLYAGQGLVWARIALALDRIEQPALKRSLAEVLAAAGPVVDSRRGAAYQLASQIPGWLGTDPPRTKSEVFDRIRISDFRSRSGREGPASPADMIDEFTIQRALAIAQTAGYPRVPAALEGAPWLPPREAGVTQSWVAWAAACLPVLLAIIWLGNSLALRKAFLRRRPPRVPPLHVELVADAAAHVSYGIRQFRQIAQQLQRRTSRPTDKIDVESTILATIASGGEVVMPVYQTARDTPEYLVLIERNAAGDQDALRLRDMIRRLERLHLFQIVVFYFRGEPSMLEPEGGGRAVPIERLRAQFSDHRLVILGSGRDLLDPVSLAPRMATARLRDWSRRALLTPLPLAEWGRNEFALASALDMPIGRATPDGLLALASMLGLDGAERDDLLDRSGDGLARPLPEILRQRPQRLFYGVPPSGLPVPELIQSLRNFLDGPGFEWLCALAIYPAVQWDLTLFLGVSIRESLGDRADQKRLYREDRIAALTQLPWLREGSMPNWLRRALIEQLSEKRAAEVRTLLNGMLSQAGLRGDRPQIDPIKLWIGRELPRDHFPTEELFEDEVLLDFLARGRIEDLALPPAASWLERLLPRNWRDRFGIPELAVLAVAFTYAVAAAMLAPKPSDGGLPIGAWLPLVALAGGGLFALIVANPAGAYRTGRAVLVRTFTFALAFVLLSGALILGSRAAVSFPLPLTRVDPRIADALLAALAASTWFAADRLRDRLGIPRRRPHGKFAQILAPAAEILVLAALVGITAAYATTVGHNSPIAVVSGVTLLVASWAAARWLPERLPPPRTAPQQRRALWSVAGGTLRVSLALLPILPAWSLSRYIAASFQDLGAAPGGISALAEMPDGNRFAISAMDGTIRLFKRNGDRYEEDKLATPIALNAPAMSLQMRRRPDGQVVLAAGTGDGKVHLFDALDGSKIAVPFPDAEPGRAPLPARIALDPGGHLLAAVERTDGGTRFLTANGHTDDPDVVTAVVAVGKEKFLAGTLDGRLRVLTAPYRAGPLLDMGEIARLPGSVRMFKVDEDGKMVLAIGDDGTLLQGSTADLHLTPMPESGYRREQFALGAVGRPGEQIFRDCRDCPQMVVVPAGDFLMGSPRSEVGRRDDEDPQRQVSFTRPFAVGRFEVTFDEWEACVVDGGCSGNKSPDDAGWGRARRPAINVSWQDAQEYVAWLSRKTGHAYRLLTEAEWEYAARAGTRSAYPWGDEIGIGHANCRGCRSQWDSVQTAPVGSFAPNGFKLFDMHGNVLEWVDDCYSTSYQAGAAAANGAPQSTPKCFRIVRGGSWSNSPVILRSAFRSWEFPDFRGNDVGLRVARTL